MLKKRTECGGLGAKHSDILGAMRGPAGASWRLRKPGAGLVSEARLKTRPVT